VTADELTIPNGILVRTEKGNIGGMGCAPATAERAAVVKLGLSGGGGEERQEVLNEGGTFEFGGETWTVAQINYGSGTSWNVVLRRLP
jgi:hypothetical protein